MPGQTQLKIYDSENYPIEPIGGCERMREISDASITSPRPASAYLSGEKRARAESSWDGQSIGKADFTTDPLSS